MEAYYVEVCPSSGVNVKQGRAMIGPCYRKVEISYRLNGVTPLFTTDGDGRIYYVPRVNTFRPDGQYLLFFNFSGDFSESIRVFPCSKTIGVYGVDVFSLADQIVTITTDPVVAIVETSEQGGTQTKRQMLFEGDAKVVVTIGILPVSEEQYCCVFPASCGKGPAAIIFYGDTLDETSVGSLIYGDTTNGARLVNGEWIIYRNGNSSTQPCLGLGIINGVAPPSVQADLASTYGVAVTFESAAPFSSTVSYFGLAAAIDAPCGGNLINCGFRGQAGWSGFGGGQTGLSDEGIFIGFNKDSCRWELRSGVGTFLFAYLSDNDQQSPIGNYTVVGDSQSGPITSVIVS